ncbi:MAG: HNH endonuclease [Reyranellaceae bacterium]
MGIGDIHNRKHVLDAIAEYDELGRNRFLQKYRFGPSHSYWLVHQGRRYDSKAVIGAAHGYARPDLGPLTADAFSGGAATVQRKLEGLGFGIEVARGAANDRGGAPAKFTSSLLNAGSVYTRDELKTLFGITDATINTGVFRPRGTSSIWLFITEEKTADRTQYRDHLEGNLLYWQGQTSGRTDDLIVEHEKRGLEILVFFRTRKYEHPGAGFRYLGPFGYVRHSGGHPTSFVLKRQEAVFQDVLSASTADVSPFDPSDVQDGRRWIAQTIVQRRGQQAFRDALIAAYDGKCVITGCAVLDVLEAAHIHPYLGPDTNKTSNGLLLRADLHTLFDCRLLAIDPEALTVIVAPHLRDSEYGALHGRAIRRSKQMPSKKALQHHLMDCGLD